MVIKNITNAVTEFFKTPVLARVIPFELIGAQAIKEAEDIFIRSDTPQEDYVPPDLQDRAINLLGTKNGFRTSGRVTIDDVNQGTISNGGILFISALLFLIFFASLVLNVGYGVNKSSVIAGSGALLVAFSIIYSFWTKAFVNGLKMFSVGICLALCGAISELMTKFFGINSSLINQVVFASIAIIPYVVVELIRNNRVALLQIQSINNTGEDQILSTTDSKKIRTEQAKQAFIDEQEFLEKFGVNNFIRFGKFESALTPFISPFIPDGGQICGYSSKDMGQHTLVVGAPGTGKTSSARSVLKQVSLFPKYGILILDGKGTLPGESKLLLDMVLDHKTPYAPIQGLTSDEIANHISSAHIKDGDHNAVFTHGAKDILRHVSEIMIHIRPHNIITGLKVSLKGIQTIGALCSVKKTRDDLLTNLGIFQNTYQNEKLAESIAFIKNFDNLPEDLLGSFFVNFKIWIEQFKSDPDLLDWFDCETSQVELSQIFLSGARIGVGVGDNYGIAGLAHLRLIKRQFYSKVKKQAAHGGPVTRFLLMIDEGHLIFTYLNDGYADDTMLAILRSLGADAFYMTQNVDQVSSSSSRDRAAGFISNFSSLITYRTGNESTFKFVQQYVGKMHKVVVNAESAKRINLTASLFNASGAAQYDTEHPEARLLRAMNNGSKFKKPKFFQEDNLVYDQPLSEQTLRDVFSDELSTRWLNQPSMAFVTLNRAGGRRIGIVKMDGWNEKFEPYDNGAKFNKYLAMIEAKTGKSSGEVQT